MWLLIITNLCYAISIHYEYSYRLWMQLPCDLWPVTGRQDVSLNFALVPMVGNSPPPSRPAANWPRQPCKHPGTSIDCVWTTSEPKLLITRQTCCGAYASTCPCVTHTHTRGWRGKVFFQLYFLELCKHSRWTVSYTSLAGTHHVYTQTPLACIPTRRCSTFSMKRFQI